MRKPAKKTPRRPHPYPYGCEEFIVSGEKHFLFRGIYYRPVVQGGVTVYRVVK